MVDAEKLSPDLVRFHVTVPKQAEELLKNKWKFKDYKWGTVSLTTTLSHTEWQIQDKIQDIAKQEKAKGNRVSVGYMTMIMNDDIFVWDHQRNMLVKVTYENDVFLKPCTETKQQPIACLQGNEFYTIG